jgi:MarR family transcriptional regulator, organic hydroperoxide resistance regulator
MAANRPGGEDLAWLLSRAAHQVSQRLCEVLGAEGLTLGQWWVLGLLADGAGHGMGEAAAYAMLPGPTLTKAVDRLVAANLVSRRADRQDRRRVLIYLTARGRRLHARLAGKLGSDAGLLGVLDDGDAGQLTQLLLGVLRWMR